MLGTAGAMWEGPVVLAARENAGQTLIDEGSTRSTSEGCRSGLASQCGCRRSQYMGLNLNLFSRRYTRSQIPNAPSIQRRLNSFSYREQERWGKESPERKRLSAGERKGYPSPWRATPIRFIASPRNTRRMCQVDRVKGHSTNILP